MIQDNQPLIARNPMFFMHQVRDKKDPFGNQVQLPDAQELTDYLEKAVRLGFKMKVLECMIDACTPKSPVKK